MKFILQPWQLMLIILASWVNRQQQEVIEYLRTENAVLRQKFGKKRILRTDDQRRRLAVKGKILGRKNSSSLGPSSRRTQSFDGIDNCSPINGTTPTEKRREQVGHGSAK